MNRWIPILVIVLCSLTAEARRYKHYLDPRNAENILAGIALRGRISQSDWLNIIHGQKNATYTVKPGDNLWNISGRLFGDAWLWRKMWQINQSILNPHEIDTGRVLAYYNENAEYGGEWRIPVVKLTPDGKGNSNDLDNDKFVNVDIKQKHRISNFVLGDEEVLGEVTGSYTSKSRFGHENELYLSFFDRSKVKVGETYVIAHEEKILRDLSDSSEPVVGKLMRTVGEVKITVFGAELVRAEITSLFHGLQRGDKVVQMARVATWAVPTHPPNDMTVRIVYGEHPKRKLFAAGNIVLLNKGIEEGMKPGFLFRVFQDTDPYNQKRDGVEPNYKGEVQVVYSGKTTSLGYIVRSQDPIQLGDTLVPSQAFDDPIPPEARPNDTVEID